MSNNYELEGRKCLGAAFLVKIAAHHVNTKRKPAAIISKIYVGNDNEKK